LAAQTKGKNYMKARWLLFLSVLVVVSLAVSACTAAVGAAPPAAGAEQPAADADQPAGCVTDGSVQYGYLHPDGSFCFELPPNFEAAVLESGQVMIESLPRGFPHPRLPFAQINISPAGELDAEGAALALQEDNLAAVPGLVIPSSSAAVAGQAAVVLDKLPGMELNRQVFFVYNGLLYQVGFYPADPQVAEYASMQELYRVILSTFAFGD
jgi:hypothetical protein